MEDAQAAGCSEVRTDCVAGWLRKRAEYWLHHHRAYCHAWPSKSASPKADVSALQHAEDRSPIIEVLRPTPLQSTVDGMLELRLIAMGVEILHV